MIRLLLLLVVACRLSASLAEQVVSDNEGVVLSSYHVSTKVSSRLVTTSIDMVFENTKNCSSLHGMSLQIPKGSVVTDLVMDLSDGCRLESEVKTLDDAVEDFKDNYEQGKPSAILTAWDMSNFELQVSIPPSGTTSVKLQLQELLFRKLDKVPFQVPMFPGVDVDDLRVDVTVEDPGLILDFRIDDSQFDETIETVLDNNGAARMHYEKRGVTKDLSLPTLLQAHFRPNSLPSGLLLTDGECFTHVFDPTKALSGGAAMARKIVFVIDVSGSMQGQKLRDAKASFSVMIDTLDERDFLTLQTFSTSGTEDLWGPKAATRANKAEAIEFVDSLETIGSTNLNDAFLDAVGRIDETYDPSEATVPIIVAMTDGQGNKAPEIVASNVRNKNKRSRAKIFSIAFGEDADMDLLLGIALQNGGRAVRIYEGFGDATNQMEQFYNEELGSLLLSDVTVSYDFGEVGVVSDSTALAFPVLAAGSEIVVRGKIDLSSNNNNNSTRILKSVVSAKSATGAREWPIDHLYVPADDGTSNGNCQQSYAQARILELLEYRDANRTLRGELFAAPAAAVSRGAFEAGAATNPAEGETFEEQARKIALDANLVWPGLTALITVENANCRLNNSDVCYSGTEGDTGPDEEFYDEEPFSDIGVGAPIALYSGARSDPRMRRGWSICFGANLLILTILSSIVLVF